MERDLHAGSHGTNSKFEDLDVYEDAVSESGQSYSSALEYQEYQARSLRSSFDMGSPRFASIDAIRQAVSQMEELAIEEDVEPLSSSPGNVSTPLPLRDVASLETLVAQSPTKPDVASTPHVDDERRRGRSSPVIVRSPDYTKSTHRSGFPNISGSDTMGSASNVRGSPLIVNSPSINRSPQTHDNPSNEARIGLGIQASHPEPSASQIHQSHSEEMRALAHRYDVAVQRALLHSGAGDPPLPFTPPMPRMELADGNAGVYVSNLPLELALSSIFTVCRHHHHEIDNRFSGYTDTSSNTTRGWLWMLYPTATAAVRCAIELNHGDFEGITIAAQSYIERAEIERMTEITKAGTRWPL